MPRFCASTGTIFYGVPTFYAALLASPRPRSAASANCAAASSAGEALPADIGRRWSERYGADILDGIGSTEMLHIYVSNRAGAVQYGTTGKPVPGYECAWSTTTAAWSRSAARWASCRCAGRPAR